MQRQRHNHDSLTRSIARLRRGTWILMLSTALLIGLITVAEARRTRTLETSELRARRVELVDQAGRVLATVDRNLVLRNTAGDVVARLDANHDAPRLELHVNGARAASVGSDHGNGYVLTHSPGGKAVASLTGESGGAIELGAGADEPLVRLGQTGKAPGLLLHSVGGRKLIEIDAPYDFVSADTYAGGKISVGFGVYGEGHGSVCVNRDGNSLAMVSCRDSQSAGLSLHDCDERTIFSAARCPNGSGGHVTIEEGKFQGTGIDLKPLARGQHRQVTSNQPPVRHSPSGTGSLGSGETQCGRCSGSGTTDCSSCGGSGYRTVSTSHVDWDGNVVYGTERQDCGSCTAGQVKCGSCYGKGLK